MKKLLNTIYILNEKCYLSLKNDNVIVHIGEEKKPVPLLGIENIVVFSYEGASPELMGECRNRGIGLSFLTPHGKFLCMPSGRSTGNVLLRKEQYRISDDPERRIKIAREMIAGKIYNGVGHLKRMVRGYPLRVDIERLTSAAERMIQYIPLCRNAKDEAELRGLEGKVADFYFSVFNELILNQKDDFVFRTRSRRPPLDRVNAMLSFGYTMLTRECASALEAIGLDSYVGFLHTDKPGRESLALDLMEEMRVLMVDRLVVSMINKKMIKPTDFKTEVSGAVYLDESGRKKFIEQWQGNKKVEIVHPFLKEKVEWGLMPHIQSLLLTRFIRGDYDGYPVLLWK